MILRTTEYSFRKADFGTYLFYYSKHPQMIDKIS
jgi:hypothetical protein